jgi:hypothetical protein
MDGRLGKPCHQRSVLVFRWQRQVAPAAHLLADNVATIPASSTSARYNFYARTQATADKVRRFFGSALILKIRFFRSGTCASLFWHFYLKEGSTYYDQTFHKSFYRRHLYAKLARFATKI